MPSDVFATLQTTMEVAPPHPDGPNLETVRLIYAEIESALDRQFEQIQILNSRAQQLLVFAGGILGLVIALRPPTDDTAVAVLFGLALLLFVVIVWLGYLSWSIVGWRRPPEPGRLWSRYQLWPESWLSQQLILNRVKSHDANRRSIDAKLRYLRLTQLMLGAEIAYLVAIVIARPFIP
jgi:hypothetical protein